MKPSYPVFLVDRDAWMYLIKTEKDLDRQLELIDVEGGEYSGWDMDGTPLSLTAEDESILCAVAGDPGSGISDLKSAIGRYGSLAGRDGVPFSPTNTHDLVRLFREADRRVDDSSLVSTLARLFGRRTP